METSDSRVTLPYIVFFFSCENPCFLHVYAVFVFFRLRSYAPAFVFLLLGGHIGGRAGAKHKKGRALNGKVVRAKKSENV